MPVKKSTIKKTAIKAKKKVAVKSGAKKKVVQNTNKSVKKTVKQTTKKTVPQKSLVKKKVSSKQGKVKIKEKTNVKTKVRPKVQPKTREIVYPDAEKVEVLIGKGRVRGFVTETEVLYIFPEVEEYVFEFELFLEELQQNGLEIKDTGIGTGSVGMLGNFSLKNVNEKKEPVLLRGLKKLNWQNVKTRETKMLNVN